MPHASWKKHGATDHFMANVRRCSKELRKETYCDNPVTWLIIPVNSGKQPECQWYPVITAGTESSADSNFCYLLLTFWAILMSAVEFSCLVDRFPMRESCIHDWNKSNRFIAAMTSLMCIIYKYTYIYIYACVCVKCIEKLLIVWGSITQKHQSTSRGVYPAQYFLQ